MTRRRTYHTSNIRQRLKLEKHSTTNTDGEWKQIKLVIWRVRSALEGAEKGIQENSCNIVRGCMCGKHYVKSILLETVA